jgi:hypothetical protein
METLITLTCREAFVNEPSKDIVRLARTFSPELLRPDTRRAGPVRSR